MGLGLLVWYHNDWFIFVWVTLDTDVGSWHIVGLVLVTATVSKVYWLCPEPPTVLVPRAIWKQLESLVIGERLMTVASVVATALLATLTHHFWVLDGWTHCRCFPCVVGQILKSYPLSPGAVHSKAKITAPHTSCSHVFILPILNWYHCYQMQNELYLCPIINILHDKLYNIQSQLANKNTKNV